MITVRDKIKRQNRNRFAGLSLWLVSMLALLAAACSSQAPTASPGDASQPLPLPVVEPMVSAGQKLHVVATTSIIGDVVRQVGDEAIDLTILMQPGQDPHSYQPGASDLTAAADANIIFINGWNLEEGLVNDLATIGNKAVLVPISAGVVPRVLSEEEHDKETHGEGHSHGPVDPHTWQDVANVIQWVENVRQVLSAADPANAALYEANAAAYRQTLQQLDADLRTTLGAIPEERRILVTNHDNLGYFARAYGFEITDSVIPSISSLAEPSAGELAALVDTMRSKGFCTLILEATASTQLARMLKSELTGCADVHLIMLYTDALGPAGSGAETYEGMMRANAATLAKELSR